LDLRELELFTGRRHPWEVARLRFFLRLGRAMGVLGSQVSVLDVGAGDGWVGRQLLSSSLARSVTCFDQGYSPEALARHELTDRPGLTYSHERPRARFDLVLLLDVLEHVEDDAGLLVTLAAENLAAGGHLLLSVPAWPVLFAAHDVWLHHHRRYRPATVRSLVERAGLRVLKSGGLFHSLLLARALGVAAERLAPGSRPSAEMEHIGAWRAPAPITAAVRAALAVDVALTNLLLRLGLSLPGLSAWALCQLPPR
jgi:SAM-dependent methyltransferase